MMADAGKYFFNVEVEFVRDEDFVHALVPRHKNHNGADECGYPRQTSQTS